jgi:hypothetical protein
MHETPCCNARKAMEIQVTGAQVCCHSNHHLFTETLDPLDSQRKSNNLSYGATKAVPAFCDILKNVVERVAGAKHDFGARRSY